MAFVISIGSRYFQEINLVHDAQRQAASDTVQRLDRMLANVQRISQQHLDLVNTTCPLVQQRLLNISVQLQVTRAVLLVKNNEVFCSSLFGKRDYDFAKMFPDLTQSGQTLMLKSALIVDKGSPTLIFWVPVPGAPRSGIVHSLHITMLSDFILEPHPYVDRMALNVGHSRLLYGERAILPFGDGVKDDACYSQASVRFPYSVSIFSAPDWQLAIRSLPQHIPLFLLVFLLAFGIVYLASANRLNLAYHISSAIQQKRFLLYCQPIIDTHSGDCTGVEILLRWHDERQGWISPDVFIPLAEQHGLIQSLTRYLLIQLVQRLYLFPRTCDFTISINIAAEHFTQGQILDDLQTHWFHHLPAPTLVLELTERTALERIDNQLLTRLHQLGARLAIDDFGTGHSSLSYLQQLQPDVLKIDRSFCATIGTDAINARVLDSMISLGKDLGLKLVAEGVETQEQVDYLKQRNVECIQGYFFSMPMPLEDFPQWLSNYRRSLAAKSMA
ncbi:EAL domain-containing protein [Enterobacillus tribolii]|uniref:EAL domain-containing protein n=1 Tax=Enterobacillus tribolii TaxID=1487935 RepID=UPI001E527B69|nr:cyclic diguanylate phosphodiesterase [Enterobacillus tribolii]